jgi:hypothetical protein
MRALAVPGLKRDQRAHLLGDECPCGLGLTTYAYDPETIVIAEELTAQFQRRQEEVAAQLHRLLVPGFPMPTLTAARFGADGCAIGAASLLHARFIDRAGL